MNTTDSIQPHFIHGPLEAWRDAPVSSACGGILVCRKGSATLLHNFRKWQLSEGSVMTFFPNDMLFIEAASEDFDASVLVYSAEMLRSASLQVEDVVYEWLRNDCCTSDPWVYDLTAATFSLLEFYLKDGMFASSGQIILLQLKAYFLGLCDRVRRLGADLIAGTGRERRTKELFNLFMEMLEKEYRTCHSVKYYAGKLSITPKHLTTVTRKISGKSAKELIDEYIIMQLKLSFSEPAVSIKETAWSYNFPSTAFLCSYFSKRTGMTPMQFRRRQLSGENADAGSGR